MGGEPTEATVSHREAQAGTASLAEPSQGLRNIARRLWPLPNGQRQPKSVTLQG